jgi:EmrB/QacA subfamily drug resistance transporter
MSSASNLPSQIPGSYSKNKWLSLIAASFGMFLGSLDITVNVALPNITSSFGTDLQTVQWIIIFYVGSTTGLQLSLGSAADIYGLKRFYIIGLIIYTLAVLLIGMAPSLTIVFGLRVLQAVGNGLLLASVPALVTSIFPPEERGRGLGLMSGIAVLGMIAGSLGGGVLVDSLGWRAIFLARVPLGILAIVMALVFLGEQRGGESPRSFDFRGGLTLFAGLAALILFLTLGGRIGWTEPQILVLAALSAGLLIGFVFLEKTAHSPILDLALLRHRVLVPVMLASYLMFMATFVNWFILPFYLSDTLGVNAKVLGFLLMLMAALGAVTAPIGGWLSDRMAPAYLTTLALMIAAVALFWFSLLDASSSVTDVAIRMAVIGIGIGLFQAANATLIMGTVPGDRLGTGGAILSLSRSMGTVSSVAILSALFASRLSEHTATLLPGNEKQAFVSAFQDIYLIAGILATVATVVSLSYWPLVLKGRSQ